MSRKGPPEALPNAAEQAKGVGLDVARQYTQDALELLKGLPAIPVDEETEHFPDVPEEASAHVPWV